MNVYETHSRIVEDYASYIQSFLNIADPDIRATVERELSEGKLWPEPLLQFNPSFKMAGAVEDLTQAGTLHPAIGQIFKGYSLYQHQVEAIGLGTSGRDFVVTSGTGSGKSLTYIGTIFHHLLSGGSPQGVAAIVVYPMNALINSQFEEFARYQENYKRATGKEFPITFGQYTGQEKEETRVKMRERPPQILLTNYMMLELLLTRMQERSLREAIYANLKFLVFDELHTYRGRQGADVAMLIRRIQAQCGSPLTCIGTSATMVSLGSAAAQRVQVATVATTLFGRPFTSDQVINETLDRSLSALRPTVEDLTNAIRDDIDLEASADSLRSNAVAVWLENDVALEDRDGALVRRRPMRISAVVAALAQKTGLPEDACQQYLSRLLHWISLSNERLQKAGQRYTMLPFRLHQFISQTGSVYTTLDQDENRFITLEPGVFKVDEAEKKPIFANVFSRASGHAFICVRKTDKRLEPREFREATDEEDENVSDGYLIVGQDIWNIDEDLEFLPESWVRTTKAGLVPESKKRPYFPEKVFFDEFGNILDEREGNMCGWFMKAPLLFDPTGGVFYDTRTQEGTKLTKLGSEGRSTSTTITAFSILAQLHDAGYRSKDQKLLSFTDNRQDAALQAGHFNDFVQVVRLRAGIQKALATSAGGSLTYSNLGEAVFNALALPFTDFATRDDPQLANIRRTYEQTFQAFILFRTVADLRRSWRIVLPNLEQCALLNIDYVDLHEVAESSEFWADMPLLNELNAEERAELLRTILDYFRLEYAIHSENFLTFSKLQEYTKHFRERLRAPWTLDRNEELREPFAMRIDPLHRSANFSSKSIGAASAIGKFLKLYVRQRGIDVDLKGAMYRSFILQLLEKLVEADYLNVQTARAEDNTEVPVFRLKIDKIVWQLGDGKTVRPDVIKRRSYKDQKPLPNVFFRDMYRRDFAQMKQLRAEDHTGQLNTEARLEREDRFRADWYQDETKTSLDESRIRSQSISALFCSPTMELGIDIGGLSVVHMRNAPPNPANYAQRSGRAGRSGQGALVFTYCSSYSAHDRHYFQNQADLVAGVVHAPRLDLCNQELLLTHLNALAISEIGLPGLESQGGGDRASLMKLIIEDRDQMPLSPGVKSGLTLSPATFDRMRATFKRVIVDIEPSLHSASAAWYSDEWIDRNLSRLTDHLDQSLDRWRRLYRSAQELLIRASQAIQTGTLTGDLFRKQQNLEKQANRQLTLLRNDDSGRSSELSEFYPYRYLASEGFLPGYNFTRLPLRIFLPTSETSGDFISRARSIALREFGPLNVIYHSGRKYRVSQLIVQDADSDLKEAVVSTNAGYVLTGDQRSREICPFSGQVLSDNANKLHLHDLLDMAESRAEEVDRISCEEEERVSRGFVIDTYFTLDADGLESVRKAVVRTSESPLLNLRYVPAARLVHVNRQWRASKSEGFPMGLTSGDWRAAMPGADSKIKEEFKLVKLWTSAVSDALYLEPVAPLGLSRNGVITLQYALKRAIETVFQAEPSEIGVVAIGNPAAPNILLYEASEGSLGILSQFVDDVDVFHKVIAEAIAICRFDDRDYLGPASYDDLLSYYNQREHRNIDRHLIKGALAKLLSSSLEIQSNAAFRDYEEHYQALLRGLDPNSSTELTFIQHLYDNGLRLPDSAQERFKGLYVQPDFYYEPRIWVFCDGTPHDQPDVRAADELKRQSIIAQGHEVWVYNYRDNLAEKVAARPDIFRKVR